MTGDFAERLTALDPARSFIVEAPAGSGKTGLLVQRFLRLLSVVDRPESIVAMTFTRKAAAEMKQRIVTALQSAQESSPVSSEFERATRRLALAALEHDGIHSWNILGDTSRLQIQTIDAFCATLVRQMPVLSGFGGSPKVVEHAEDLYRLAARRMLHALVEGDEAYRELFRRVCLHFDSDLSKVEELVAAMLAQRDKWRCLVKIDESHSQTVRDFRALLFIADAKLREVFEETGEVDFTRITQAAVAALGTEEQPTDLLYRLDYQILHLLVDEFQDTSFAQYDLLKALTAQWSDGDHRTLFLVGDPMQSIYGFREAEVALFLKAWAGALGSVRLTPIQLKTNFRSTHAVVDWIQQAISAVMPEADLPIDGAVRLRRSVAAEPSGGIEPQVHAFIGDRGVKEAEEIAALARKALRNGEEVAILVRSRSHLSDILPLLEEHKIPYEAVDIDRLESEQHIIDLISLTRAAVHVGDRVAWLACLRAPWCGLTLADLSHLAENEPKRTILDLLSDPDKVYRLSPDGRVRAIRFQEAMSECVKNAGRVPLRDLIERTWLALGGPAVLRGSNQQLDIETYLTLLEEFDQGGIVRDFSLLDARLENLYAEPRADNECVKVLTIHTAKGLEFDTVILPRLAAVPPTTRRELLIWRETEDGLEIEPCPAVEGDEKAYQALSDALKPKRRHEVARMLYVAMTRARTNLHLFGNATLKKNGEVSKAPIHTHLGMIWPAVARHFEAAARGRKEAYVQTAFATPAESELRRLPSGWQAPQFAEPVRWQPELRRAAASARKVTYEWVSETGRYAGTVVHELLKRIAAEGSAFSTAERVEALRGTVQSELLRLGVDAAEEPAASAQVFRALRNTLSSERGQWILAARPGARSEWALGGRVRSSLLTAMVDRAFRDDQGRFWIVDYKTSEHAGGMLARFLDEEQRRYRPQLDNYAALVSKIEVGPIWLGLYFPLLDAWREWQFEEAAQTAAYTGE